MRGDDCGFESNRPKRIDITIPTSLSLVQTVINLDHGDKRVNGVVMVLLLGWMGIVTYFVQLAMFCGSLVNNDDDDDDAYDDDDDDHLPLLFCS